MRVQALGRALEDPAVIRADVGNVRFLLQPRQLFDQARLATGQGLAPCAVRIQHREDGLQVPAQHGHVVDHISDWVIDLVGHARRQPAEAGELLRLHEGRLGLAQVMLEADDPLSRAEADSQFVAVERFGQEIVGAGVHPLHEVFLLGLRRQEHRVDISRALEGADAADQARAVELGHHPVGDDHGEGVALEEPPRLGAVPGGGYLVAPLLQVVLQ